MTYTPQVGKEHYSGNAYSYSDRWMSYFYQLELVRRVHARTVLEVGVGAGVLARELRARGISVKTLDIAPDVSPDVVGSVTDIPIPEHSFDATLAFEVLEHIRDEDVSKALSELARVSKQYVILSLPHPGWVFSFNVKVPLLPRVCVLYQIPFFWKKHVFNGEHYWELGKKGFSVRRFISTARGAGLTLVSFEKHADDPGHRFFVFKKV
ncbi:class I SAM-dependent methyltransferase [Candidatus Parcubacteria bacterium]|nr:MAG: class I SAM-dependent methyltransferase [Candidatus Parcubacteria bacterium]